MKKQTICPLCGNTAINNTDYCEQCDEANFEMLRHDYHCHTCGFDAPTKFDGQSFAIFCF